ncbi:hypothetical protein [Mycobacterium camsae]|uniref:hypothetical protein n=1 Tax=Mycobacterium gordonae TaxID=1778 RepID=UPI00197F5285|nr:hypothetical protein [Mycobacterium gordonae]
MSAERETPGRETGGTPQNSKGKAESSDETDQSAKSQFRRQGCQYTPASQDLRSQLRRRRDAARRVAPLDCRCFDPWPCRCSEPPLSDRRIDGGRDAALHILATGRVPLLEIEVLQALWRRGGTDRELAQLLHRLTNGAVA